MTLRQAATWMSVGWVLLCCMLAYNLSWYVAAIWNLCWHFVHPGVDII